MQENNYKMKQNAALKPVLIWFNIIKIMYY